MSTGAADAGTGSSIRPASITVGSARPNSDNQVLQP